MLLWSQSGTVLMELRFLGFVSVRPPASRPMPRTGLARILPFASRTVSRWSELSRSMLNARSLCTVFHIVCHRRSLDLLSPGHRLPPFTSISPSIIKGMILVDNLVADSDPLSCSTAV